jgi:predicted nuclease of predicted toxin-antitoxin system
MARFLIDANLPYRFALWQGLEYTHVFDLDDTWPDSEIWRYAKAEGLTIVTKDADFSARAMVSQPPPRVIHLRIGNLRMRDFHKLLPA